MGNGRSQIPADRLCARIKQGIISNGLNSQISSITAAFSVLWSTSCHLDPQILTGLITTAQFSLFQYLSTL